MNYHNITTDDMLNGDGLRTVLWVAGCGHACPGCQNPVTWDACGGLPFDEVRARFPKKTIWLYTGYTYEEIMKLPVLGFVDVLVDGRYDAAKRDVRLHWKGSSNQRVIDVPATRAAGEIVLHDTDYGKEQTR